MFFISAILALLMVTGAPNQPPPDARTEIEKTYRKADAASIAARTLDDLEAIRNWLDTPDCVYTEFGQPSRRWSDMRAYAAEGLRTRIVSFRSQIEQLDVTGRSAIATTRVVGVARITDREGRFGPKDVTHDVETSATVKDEWVWLDHWRRKSHTKVVANHVTAIDGKPLNR
jgi:hypothetical protein